MNIEIEQQQKFQEQFAKLAEGASQKFKDKWDNEITFTNPTREKMTPTLNAGALHLLSTELRKKFETLRHKYFEKKL